MNLIALLLGLAIERLLTHLFHLREFRWLDPFFDRVFGVAAPLPRPLMFAAILLALCLLVLPVVVAGAILDEALFRLLYFAFAIIVLLFSLGPRDLKEEADEYRLALEGGDPQRIRNLAKELLETDPPDDPVARDQAVERAVFVQANNRIFGVLFWFLLLGPAGAWLFRVIDLMRRRAAYRCPPEDAAGGQLRAAVQAVHAALAWIPARLLAVSYALAGSFEEAIADWRAYYQNCAERFFDINNDVLACAGSAAAGRAGDRCELRPGAPVAAAMDLVLRSLWLIWCPAIAVLTLYDLVS
ncbi:MAG: regulatory signaling modulator protein AmpE [Gammaproteobacteria bacterium]|nr:MAG: regulatory signaling modulator protein AmpE [Gammaproteobacteria bacterium]